MPMLSSHKGAFSRALAGGARYVTIKLQRNIDYDRVAPLANLAEPFGWRVEAVWFSELGITNVLFRHETPPMPSDDTGRDLKCQ